MWLQQPGRAQGSHQGVTKYSDGSGFVFLLQRKLLAVCWWCPWGHPADGMRGAVVLQQAAWFHPTEDTHGESRAQQEQHSSHPCSLQRNPVELRSDQALKQVAVELETDTQLREGEVKEAEQAGTELNILDARC